MNFNSTLHQLNAVVLAAEVMRQLAKLIRSTANYNGDLDARGHVAILELLALSNLNAPNHLLARIDAARGAMELIEARCKRGGAPARAIDEAARAELGKLYDLVDALQVEAARPRAPEASVPRPAPSPKSGPKAVEITVIPARLPKGPVAAGAPGGP